MKMMMTPEPPAGDGDGDGAAMSEQTSAHRDAEQHHAADHGHDIERDGGDHHDAEHGRTFFTVGHSTLSLEEFIAMLRGAGVGLVVDVRRLPGSKRYPWFDAEPLAEALREAGIGYRRAAGLTGRRPKSKDVDPSVNAFWQNQSFHNYADHAQSDEFAEALADLQADGDARPATLCAEAVWWRCHRRLITDALLARGEDVVHLMGPGKREPAKLTPSAQVDDGRVTYPAEPHGRPEQASRGLRGIGAVAAAGALTIGT